MASKRLTRFLKKHTFAPPNETEADSIALEHTKERPKYANYTEFILSTIGYSAGLGNVWRFPQLAYECGGGAFLLPYWFAIMVVGLPLYFMELAVGQYVSLGPCIIFAKIAPIAQGIGWAMFVASLVIITYYTVVMAWAIYYLILSFRPVMLWEHCRNEWNTYRCHSVREDAYCKSLLNDTGALFYNQSCWNSSMVTAKAVNSTLSSISKVSPADEFYNRYILNTSSGFEEMGALQWPLVGCLALAWIMIVACIFKGVKTTGKAVYITAIFPYLIIFTLLMRGVTLPGAANGLYYYLVPDFKKLWSIDPWFKAATQVFYSLNIATGGVITIASYTGFHNNCKRDAFIITTADTLTSIFSGCAIFSILGFIAQDLGVDVPDVTKSGPGLTFIAYPEAIVRMPLSSLWAILFFVMLLLLGIDSLFGDMETVITCLLDAYPALRKYRTGVIMAISGLCFSVGLIFCTNGGVYYFTAFDDYGASYTLVIVGFCELVVIGIIYGAKRFASNIEEMLNSKPSWYWIISWSITGPFFLLVIFFFSVYNYLPSEYGNYIFTGKAQTFGWLLGAMSFALVPAFALFNLIRKFIAKEDLRAVLKVEDGWQPSPTSFAEKEHPSSSSVEDSVMEKGGSTISLPGSPNVQETKY